MFNGFTKFLFENWANRETLLMNFQVEIPISVEVTKYFKYYLMVAASKPGIDAFTFISHGISMDANLHTSNMRCRSNHPPWIQF